MLVEDCHFVADAAASIRLRNSRPCGASKDPKEPKEGCTEESVEHPMDMSSCLKPSLMSIHEIPKHLQFNKYVLSHYRPATNWVGCLRSLFYLHNETVNIISHAIPTVALVLAIPYLLPYDQITVPYLPAIHVMATISPWIGSTLYHLFMNHQHGYPVYKMLLTLDMLGIWITQSAGGLVTICATIYCVNGEVQRQFLICYAFLCIYCLYKAMTAQCAWSRRFSFTTPFMVRAAMVALRAVGLGGGHPDAFMHLILQDNIAILGAFIGATNIPERWFPGSLDLLFNSHHIMHAMVLYAVYQMHLSASLDLQWMSQVDMKAIPCPDYFGRLQQHLFGQH